MSYRVEKNTNELVIDGFQNGIAPSPYLGISNIRNLNTSYYPGVAYVNYRRQASTISGGTMTNPVGKAVSPAGLIYILDASGQVWKQSAVNSSTFNLLGSGTGRAGSGAKGIAYINNYLAVFGGGFVEFCGDGTGDSTIVSTNWNLNHNSKEVNFSVFTTNYASTLGILTLASPTNLNYFPVFNNGDTVKFSTTGTLPAPLSSSTTYYLAVNYAGTTAPIYLGVSLRQQDTSAYTTGTSISSGATSASLKQNWSGTTGNYMIIFSDGEIKTVTVTNGSNALSWTGGLVNSVTNVIQICVLLTSDGTGTQTITDNQNPLPLGNATGVNIFFNGYAPYSGASFDLQDGYYGHYTDPLGNTVNGVWKGASGTYNLIMGNGQKVACILVNNSPTITFLNPLTNLGSGVATWSFQLIDTSVTDYRPRVSKVDSALYFANGQFLGRVLESPNTNLDFSPGIASTYAVNFGATSIVNQADTIIDTADLRSTMIIAGNKDLYTWDYASAQSTAPVPVGEPIGRIYNLLNNIYVTAGQKGNLYVTNGYTIQLLQKLPDYIAGVIDPVWTFGDLIFHRARLFVQALAQNTAGTNLLAGIFSMIVSPSLLGEEASGLVMESQNSYGLTPASGATGAGLLIDSEPSSNGQDSYYSAWSNGSATGGIDYNDTTEWQNYEPLIETDIIPIGSILTKKTLGQVQFKLDRPMVSGDSIKLYARASLSDSYTLIGTSSTAQLSENFPSNLSQSQWLQFKITMKCASSGSSRIPLREIRIQINE